MLQSSLFLPIDSSETFTSGESSYEPQPKQSASSSNESTPTHRKRVIRRSKVNKSESVYEDEQVPKKKKENKKSQDDYQDATTASDVTTAASGNLDVIKDDVPPIQTYFNSKKYYNKSILALDIGSSFSKAMKVTVCPGLNTGECSNLSFTLNNDFLFSTSIFYSKKDNTYCVGKPNDFSQHADEWIELENIKRIFTVQELMTVTIGGQEFQVSQVIYELIKGLLQKLIHSKERKFNKTTNNLGIYSAFILTCPTGTSENIKKVYRNCALAAMNDVSSTTIQIQDVFIIEEFMLLKYCCDQENDCQEPTLYVDIGHLTLDVTVVETIEQKSEITYRNGEVGGLSIIHNIKKQGADPYEIMKYMFDSVSEELPDMLKSIHQEIVEGMTSIVSPLCLIILQKQIKRVHVAGAVTKCPYFAKILNGILNRDSVVSMIEKRRKYFKKEFIESEINDFSFSYALSGRSALITGIQRLIDSSLSKNKNMPLCLESTNSIEENQYYGGLLYEVPKKKEFGINVRSVVYDMVCKQDFEIFIIKFSSIIDVGKVQRITSSNYDLVGVMEFERFSTLDLFVGDKLITITNQQLFVKVDVDKENVTLHFMVGIDSSLFRKWVLEITRKGRMERVPLNDSAAQIFFKNEPESTTWYGLNYTTNYSLPGAIGTDLSKSEVSKEFKGFEIEMNQINPMQFKKAARDIGGACENCGEQVKQSSHKVTPKTLDHYRAYLNRHIECGRICEDCFNRCTKNSNNGLPTQ
ncbi:hypothetical protein C9374_005565 [Naegleria lovaniensis]|uniref:Uncharacterized protein n=1 Tax=Naegleria lovaniensis TaxID=51637 RepID=A0AA88GQL1_NAELO|nr:uncharacterized protein C9374_005565 [Naegleria lovaniensis]KAG2382363.1 hypothetical protein C9374_005565 [Naegleria lovaniensis]